MNPLARAILDARCGPIESTTDGGWEQALCLGPDFIGFAGHFPDNPLLPAFVQLRIAQTLIATALSRPLVLGTVFQAKFQRPIRPGETATFAIQMTAGTEAPLKARVQVRVNAERAASFQIAFDR